MKKLQVGVNDLKTMYPDLMIDWDYQKNNEIGLFPDKLLPGSGKRAWWKCHVCGYSWQTAIRKRAEQNNDCPVCINRVLLTGYNDLVTKCPEIAKEWDYKKNGKLTPDKVLYVSNKEAYWICSTCGNEWRTRICYRSRGSGCPACALKSRAKKKSLAKEGNSLEDKFPYIKNIWDYEKNGNLLPKDLNYGSNRRIWCKCEKGHNWDAVANSLIKSHNCPVCSNKKLLVGYNDLETVRPDLAKEWDYEENGNLLPSQILFGSSKRVAWKCQYGHKWNVSVFHRVNGNRNCPFCAGQKAIIGVNDLQTVNPKLAEEWNYEKNGNLLPSQVMPYSQKKVWWKCKKGHDWQAFVYVRSSGSNCPICGNKKLLVGYNDLETVRPDLAREWNYKKNGNLLPSQVLFGSNKKVWWICDKGHEWEAIIASRNNANTGCPICANKQVLAGYNDLATTHPDLVKEWNRKKNGKLLPTMVLAGSSKKVWWECSFGHEWQAVISSRSNGAGCPTCGSIFSTSFAEQSVYYFFRKIFGKKEDIINRYKFVDEQGFFEIDIFIPSIALAIEYDGMYWHKDKVKNDKQKEARLVKIGIRLFRICESNKNEIIDNIIYYNYNRYHFKNLSWAIKSLFELLGYKLDNFDIDVLKHRIKILNLFHKTEIANSLAVVNPELVKEWNFKKNGDLKPEYFRPGSEQIVWWICKHGHEWEAKINSRHKGTGCPICANLKVLKGYNDLESKYPEIAKEWDYSKNGDLLPSQVVFGSTKSVWWTCHECGHNWQTRVRYRTNGSNCPKCGKRKRRRKIVNNDVGKHEHNKF